MGTDEQKLLDNGWQVLLFRNGLGSYSALAVRDGDSVDDAMISWVNHEPNHQSPVKQWPFDGPNRFCGEGFSVAEALRAVTEKILFRRLPRVN